ncbi:MAG: hypothetical protein K0S57_2065 [Ramlibacter sp.]|jgi:hypothetical protein|nr:hypothetical protein [Ramlibacter sp.]
MKYSLRKTPSHLQLTYKYGEANGGLLGRNLFLEVDGSVLTLEVDLSANLLARNKQSSWYLDAVSLSSNFHKLKSLQCPDNLVRTRLIRAWEGVADPRLRMRLVLSPRGSYLYEVAPHSLFMGGIQLDVQAFLEEESDTGAAATEASAMAEADDPDRKHAP